MANDERLIKTLRNIQDLENGKSQVINTGDAEACEYRGWAEAQPGGGWRLTEKGRRVLERANRD